jgi:hypothetical protein
MWQEKRRRYVEQKRGEMSTKKETFGDDLARNSADSNIVEAVYKARYRNPTL